jgi:hypothetical protein
MKKYLNYLLLALVALAGCKSCDREDPCPSTRRTNANFYVYEWDVNTNQKLVGGGEIFRKYWEPPMDTDTTCTNWVEFVAEDPNADRYEWVIGLDTFRTRSVSLGGFHNSNPLGRQLTVSLKTWKKPDRNCFPDDSGFAEKKRTIVSFIYEGSLFVNKDYLVTLDNGDTSTFSLRGYLEPRNDYGTHGITADQDTVYGFDMSIGYKKLVIDFPRQPKDSAWATPYGWYTLWAKVDPNNYRRITGNYFLTKPWPPSEIIKRGTFTGIRK